MKKHLLVISCGAILLALAGFVSSAYFNSRRAEHQAAAQRSAVHALTQQELARAVAECDAARDSVRPEGAARDAKYCEDVAREMDDRPLEIVKQKPAEPPLLNR